MRNGERRFLAWLILVLPLFRLMPGVTQAGVVVGWELDLSEAKIVDSFAEMLFHDETARKKVQERYSVAVVDGVLRMTGNYGTDGANNGDYVQLFINFPGGIDLTKFPVFEVEWRTNAPTTLGCLLLSTVSQTATGENAGSYYYPDAGKTGEWSTSINQYVPDAGFPTRGTPVKMTRVAVRAYSEGATGEYALEIRSFKVRGFTDDEAAEYEKHLSIYRDFKLVGVPQPWASEIFMFGPRGYCRGPEGYESWYDNVVRCHGNMSADQFSQGSDWMGWEKLPPVDEFIEARRKELAVARPRGLYIQPVLALAGEMKNRGPDGLAWAESYARKLADAFKDEPYLAGWFFADEVSDDWLWAVVAAKGALDRADPAKLSIMNHFGISRILRFEPYLSVVMTDHYPIKAAKRDPWSIGPWCREMAERSDRPHWVFLPAFGHSDWWQPDEGKGIPVYLYPTRAELRLMTHLAIANGINGITYYLYSTPNLWPGIFDAIGNPIPLDDPLVQDISAVGEKLAEIGPMLLTTTLLAEDAAKAVGDGGDTRGLSVGVRRAPDGGAFLIVVNESVEKAQGGRVSLSGQQVGRGRFIYDLYALRKTNPARPFGFKVTDLVPGDGRVYFVGTPQQFDHVRSAMLRNRALEILRVANLDRLVAERWNVDVSAIDAQFEMARRAASHGETDESEKARDMVQALLDGNTDFGRCRRVMLETRELLGRAYYTAHRGFHVAWPGCEALLNPTLNLFKRFSPLAERYYRGEKEGLRKLFEELGTEGEDLLLQARAMRSDE